MAKDIAPELLEKIQNDFESSLNKNVKLKRLQKKIEQGIATYEDAQEYSIEIGNLLSKAFGNNLSSDVLPNGKMYYNIANRVLPPPIKKAYTKASEYAGKVQEGLNKKAGINIKNVGHAISEDRISGIVDIVSGKDDYNKIAYMLQDPIVNLCQSAVDMTVQANADFHYQAGLSPKVTRITDGHCCDWCSKIAGEYNYPDVPKNVYRRHKNCGCVVIYDPKDGSKLRGVHSKQQYDSVDRAERAERILNAHRDSLTPEQRSQLARDKQREGRAKRKSLLSKEEIQKYVEMNESIDTPNEKLRELIRSIEDNGKVKYNIVKKNKRVLTESEIIARISGEDNTGGSCASLTLAYLGQKKGYNVTDMRGGSSKDYFAIRSNRNEIWETFSPNCNKIVNDLTDAKAGKSALESMKDGEEYILSVGSHASVVRRSINGKYQYLELQLESGNGWKDFDESLESTLKNRFKASTDNLNAGASIVSIGDINETEEIGIILGYINTSAQGPNNKK